MKVCGTFKNILLFLRCLMTPYFSAPDEQNDPFRNLKLLLASSFFKYPFVVYLCCLCLLLHLSDGNNVLSFLIPQRGKTLTSGIAEQKYPICVFVFSIWSISTDVFMAISSSAEWLWPGCFSIRILSLQQYCSFAITQKIGNPHAIKIMT